MEYKLTFNNGRSTVIECEDTGTPLQDKINKAEKQFGSEVVKVNDKPIQKHELGGFLVGALIGAGIGVVATRTRKTATTSTAKKKTTTGATKTPAGNTSKKYLPNGLIKSINTTSGKRIMNKDIVDGTYPKTAVKVPANNRYSKIAKNLDSDKTLSSQTNYLSNRRVKSVNTTFGKNISGDQIKDGFYIKDGVKFAKGGSTSKSIDLNGYRVTNRFSDFEEMKKWVDKERLIYTFFDFVVTDDETPDFRYKVWARSKEPMLDHKIVYAKGGSVGFNRSNLQLLGFKNDTNGNKVIRVSFPNKTPFSIQTNGNLLYSHHNFNLKTKIAELTPDDLELIEVEVLHYIQLHGSKAQKESLKIYDENLKYAKGGDIDRLVGSFYFDTRKNKTFQIIYSDKNKISIQYFDKNKQEDGKIIDVLNDEFKYLTEMGAWSKYKQSYFAKGGALSKATYIPNRDIESLKTTYGQTIDGKKLIDGAYATGKVKKPTMSRTQFEDETFEYAKGGNITKPLYIIHDSEIPETKPFKNLRSISQFENKAKEFGYTISKNKNNTWIAIAKTPTGEDILIAQVKDPSNNFGKYAKGGSPRKFDKKTFFMVIKNWVYFTFNYPHNFVADAFKSKHIEDKFQSSHSRYGSISVMPSFWNSLDGSNRRILTNYVQKNYFNTRADQNRLLDINPEVYNEIITIWSSFGNNYPYNFVKAIYNSEHIESKFSQAYEKAGSIGVVNQFFVELSGDNQKLLTDFVYDTYNNSPKYKQGGALSNFNADYMDIGQFSVADSDWKNYSEEDFLKMGKKIVDEQFDGDIERAYDNIVHKKMEQGGYLPNGLVKSVDTTSGKRIFNKDIIDGVYPAGDLKVPANNRYSKIAKNLDSDKNLTEQTNYLPKRRIKSVNTTFGKRLYPNDIKDGMYIKSGVKFATGGAVRKSGNEAKYQRQVDEVNRLISLAFDSIGDPIPVVDINSTWEQPYVYLPVKYTNGTLRISYYEVGGSDHGKVKKDIVKKSEMYFDNPLPIIARMYRKAIKQNKKQEENF
jgi:hypothetical protein